MTSPPPTESQPNLQPTEITFDSSTALVGGTVFFDSGIRNTGGVDTGVFNIKWFVNGQEVEAARSHAGVPASQTVLDGNSQFSWTFDSPGTYSVTFTVDVDNRVEESNEEDNSTTVEVVVSQPPDITPPQPPPGPPPPPPPPAPAPQPTPLTFNVDATLGWQTTSLEVTAGQQVSFSASGSWSVDHRNFSFVGPDGYSPEVDSTLYQGCKLDPQLPYGMLLARIGDNPSLLVIGSATTLRASQSGVLSFRIHDNDACLGDNAGSVTVTVTTQGGSTGPDADGDGVANQIEVLFGANPNLSDTDGDGLTDQFEILHAVPFHDPAKADTDGNGARDADEDIDADSLTALEEQTRGINPLEVDTDRDKLQDGDEVKTHLTNPLQPDTDSDGLTDGEEVTITHTDPLKPDTDGDGVRDSEDTVESVATTPDGVRVMVTGPGNLAEKLSISKLSADSSHNYALGQVGDAFEIMLDASAVADLQSARIVLPYDPAALGGANPANLRIFVFDETLHFWIPVEDQAVDTATSMVSATVNHFSTFAIFNIANWQQSWQAQADVCVPRTDEGTVPVFVDLVFAIDSSGSMAYNDPQGLRREAAKNFVDVLLDEDRAAVVDFDGSSQLRQPLTSDKAALKSAIDLINSAGGTNIGAGVGTALEALAASPLERAKLIILLTDGRGPFNNALINTAKARGVRIFTIGLGSDVDAALLTNIAESTGGIYTPVADASQLPEVFRKLESTTGDTGVDTDGDGLTDCQESQGARDLDGMLFTSDPELPDTDGDGLLDGEEIGKRMPLSGVEAVLDTQGMVVDLGESAYHPVLSDPRKPDTDEDEIEDGEEFDNGTDPRSTDSDNDGLSDFDEASWGTFPKNKDTDGDTFRDAFEIANLNAGFDSLTPTIDMSKWSYTAEFTKGAILGEFSNLDTIPAYLGNIASGVAPGVGIFADLRDALGLLGKGDNVGASLSILGVIPIAGDTGVIIARTLKFVGRSTDKIDEVLLVITKSDWAPDPVKRGLLEEIGGRAFKEALNTLRAKGFDDDTLLRLAKSPTMKLEELAKAVSRPNAQVIKGGIFYEGRTGWREAENVLRAGMPRPGRFPKNEPKDFIRYPDVEINLVAKEAKTGFVKNSDFIRKQIEKDRILVDRGESMKVEWHFYPSGYSNSIGADPEILDFLDANNIPYFFISPKNSNLGFYNLQNDSVNAIQNN